MGGFLFVGDLIFSYSYLISFVGAFFYCITSLLNIDLTAIFINKTMEIVINVTIGLTSILSIYHWYNQSAPIIGSVLISNQNIIKEKE
jgi:hypothetical protein